jgi:hypothetical protein
MVAGKRGGKMRVGDTVKILKCESKPELVGKTAQIVDLQIQQYEKYRTYSIWAKMTQGERSGKIYGFREGEIEVLAPVMAEKVPAQGVQFGEKAVRTKVIERFEEMFRGALTSEEITEIERRINEAKGKIPSTPGKGFWEGKTPCWEMFRCPEAIRNECSAFKERSYPCWEIEGTYSKLYNHGEKGDNVDVCRICRVYKKYGQGQPIEIKLVGKGFNLRSPSAREASA